MKSLYALLIPIGLIVFIASAQETDSPHYHAINANVAGTKAPLTIVLEADCAPCMRAYTEVVARQAAHDPLLEDREIRWVPAGTSPSAVNAAARALEKGSIDGFGVPFATPVPRKYLEQARENAASLKKDDALPMFIAPGHDIKKGFSNWQDFASWLSPSP